MATKTFKIGEVCSGGIITANVTAKEVILINKQWDYSKGTRRSSDQTNAQEILRGKFKIGVNSIDFDLEYEMERFLTTLTTSYHADAIIKWVKTKVK